MGLESFYLAVKTAIFSSRGAAPAPHPALRLGARPPDPRVRSQRPQNLELGYRQKSPLPVRPRKKKKSRNKPSGTRPAFSTDSAPRLSRYRNRLQRV